MGMTGMTEAAMDRALSVSAPSHKLWTVSCKTDWLTGRAGGGLVDRGSANGLKARGLRTKGYGCLSPWCGLDPGWGTWGAPSLCFMTSGICPAVTANGREELHGPLTVSSGLDCPGLPGPQEVVAGTAPPPTLLSTQSQDHLGAA